MSIWSATRKGTRCAVSVGTHSTVTPSASAMALATSMSKPSHSPASLRVLMLGKFGLMPTRITPSAMMSSSDLAVAGSDAGDERGGGEAGEEVSSDHGGSFPLSLAP